MSVRLFHRGGRLVVVVRRVAVGDERWWSPHRVKPDWRAILGDRLSLLGLPPESGGGPGPLSCRLGTIDWSTRQGWSMIVLRLNRGSETKRRLVAAALLRAARYGRSSSRVAKEGRWPV